MTAQLDDVLRQVAQRSVVLRLHQHPFHGTLIHVGSVEAIPHSLLRQIAAVRGALITRLEAAGGGPAAACLRCGALVAESVPQTGDLGRYCGRCNDWFTGLQGFAHWLCKRRGRGEVL